MLYTLNLYNVNLKFIQFKKERQRANDVRRHQDPTSFLPDKRFLVVLTFNLYNRLL